MLQYCTVSFPCADVCACVCIEWSAEEVVWGTLSGNIHSSFCGVGAGLHPSLLHGRPQLPHAKEILPSGEKS